MAKHIWHRVLPYAAVTAAVSVVVGYAVATQGYAIDQVDLNDSGVWVTNNSGGVYGRVNLTAGSLDGYLYPGAASDSLDMFQDGTSVVARDVANGQLIPVDPAQVVNVKAGQVAADPKAHVGMAAGSIAELDPKGDLRVTKYQQGDIPDLSALDPSAPAVASLGAAPGDVDVANAFDVAVGVDGTVFAVSTSGKQVTVPAQGAYAFGAPVKGTVPGSLKGVQATAVGDDLVYMDPTSGVVYLPGGKTAQVPSGQDSALQMPSPTSSVVFVASRAGLFAVPLAGGAPKPLSGDDAPSGTGTPARPVVVAGWAYAAWPGTPGVVESAPADASAQATSIPQPRDQTLTTPVFRVNHERVVLNDMTNGTVFDVSSRKDVVTMDDWTKVQRPQDTNDQSKTSTQQKDTPPSAVDDTLGARPGRTSVLHVLDNDTDPTGGILAVTAVTAPSGDSTATISSDGQTVLFTAGSDTASTSTSFRYTVSNGSGESQATVTVNIEPDSTNSAPVLRSGYQPVTYPVASGASTGVFVTQDWRDPDGDPVSVQDASVNGAPVPVSSEGEIHFTAAKVDQETPVTVDYTVTDGHAGGAAKGTVTMDVLAAGATSAKPPIAEPDYVRAQTGVPVSFYPLNNDVAGADPLDPTAALTLSGSVTAPAEVQATTDLVSGEVTATADKAGTYTLTYNAGFGSAISNQAQIRLDVVDQGATQPTATPDFVTVRGTVPTTVDVLANDTDPTGSVLTVTGVQPADPDQVSAAVFDGRWVRVQADTPTLSPNPQIVHYTVTDGDSDPVQGDITVTQLPAPATDTLILADDTATVRSGDSALIDVLANDSSQSGQTLQLDPEPDPTMPGQLQVLQVGASATAAADPTKVGQAFVVQNQIRYNAPAGLTEPIQVAIPYNASTTGGGTSQTATLTIDVKPAPTATTPDVAPAPKPVEARGTPGDEITIPIPIYGVDPDGDSVTVVGIASAPTKGRITAITPTSITYEGFPSPDTHGTDQFTYEVADQYGLTGLAQVRVGLTPPGLFPPSVAIDDTVTAQPGAAVTVQPMGNDLITPGDDPQVVPIGGELPNGVALSSDGATFTATAPAAGAAPVQFSYLLRGAGGDSAPAVVTIKSQAGFLNPPQVYDATATVSGDTASAKPLATAWDVDGASADITLASVGAGKAQSDGSVADIPVKDHIQAISYVAKDADGATSSAVIFVPAAGGGAPEVRADVSAIQMDQNSTKTIDLSDYIFSPRGRDISITVASSLSAAPASGLTVQAASPTSIALTSQGDYIGPAAVSLEVTDGAVTDDTALRAFLTIPVQIGPATPVLRCPTDVQQVVQGGPDVPLDITALCHVWAPDPTQLAGFTYTAEWAGQQPSDVTATSGHQVTLSAAGDATPGADGTLTIGIKGTSAVTASLSVKVVAAGKPKVSAPDLTDIKQGSVAQQTVSVSSPLRDAVPTVVSVTQTSGPACAIGDLSGAKFTLTPAADAHGVMTFTVVASDLADKTRTDRQVTTSFSMTVYGRPDPPSPPVPGTALLTHSVALTWTPGADNGAPITDYQVQSTDGKYTTDCHAMTRCDVTGVPNGQPIAFKVRAQNKADWSDWSAAGPAFTPNEVPGVAGAFQMASAGDGSVTLTWTAAPVDGTPVTAYHLTWSGGANGSMALGGSATSATVTGLDNNLPNTFKLVAENAAGMSALTATTQAQSSGRPLDLSAPTINPQDLGDTTQVTVSWPAAAPNGPAPVTYTVTRTGGSGGTKTFAPTTSTTVGDQISYDGQQYTYSVTAVNGTGGADHTTSPVSSSFVAIGVPANWAAGAATVTPTGNSGELKVDFTYPKSRGATESVKLSWSGAATGSTTVTGLSAGGGQSSKLLTGIPNGTPLTVTLQACNENKCNGTPIQTSGTAFGKLATPGITATAGATGDRNLCATATADAMGASATLVVTASNGQTSPAATGTGALKIDGWCTQASGPNVTLTFTATLTTGATTPVRANPTPNTALASATTPLDPPAALNAAAVKIAGDGNDGELQINVGAGACNGDSKGCTLKLTWSGGATGSDTSPIPASSTNFAYNNLLLNATNGSTVTLTAQVCNSQVCNTAVTATGAAYGPLDKPTINAYAHGGAGDHQVCATVSGNGNGLATTVHLTSSKGGAWDIDVPAGSFTTSATCTDIGASSTTTFTAIIKGNGTRKDSPGSDPKSASTQADPPPPATANAGFDGDYVTLTTSNFPAGTYTVEFWGSYGGWSPWATCSVAIPANGTVTRMCGSQPAWFGYPGYQVYLKIDGWGQTPTITR